MSASQFSRHAQPFRDDGVVILKRALDAEAMAGSDHLVIFCGSNDAGRSDWDLAVTAGWIEMGIVAGLLRGLEVVVVVPPPVFRNYPVHRSVRNGRLRDLRDAIYALAAEHGVVVADVWLESFLQPVPASHFPDGLHFDEAGRAFAAAAIAEAVAAWIPPPSDRDADGVPDATDLCPSHRSPLFGLNHADTDGDGAGDACDNCRETPNGPLLPDAGGNAQRDDDGDGYGNACDCDFDGDCLCDGDDFDRLLPVLAAGHDAEGIGADMDGNGALDADDFSRFLASLARGAPGPGAASGAPPPPD